MTGIGTPGRRLGVCVWRLNTSYAESPGATEFHSRKRIQQAFIVKCWAVMTYGRPSPGPDWRSLSSGIKSFLVWKIIPCSMSVDNFECVLAGNAELEP